MSTGSALDVLDDPAGSSVRGVRAHIPPEILGLLERVGKGAYAATDELAAAGPWAAYAVRSRGFVMSRTKRTLAAGWSAVALRGLPCLGAPPELPTAVDPSRTGSGSQRTRYGIVHRRDLPCEHRGSYAGCPIVRTAWMVVDLARVADRSAALVLADAVLHRGTVMTNLRRALNQLCGWPGSGAVAWVVDRADGRSESALETLGRLACIDGCLPVPLSNVWVGPGYPLYRVDHLWPWHWVVAEGDGALKYRTRDPAQVIAAEKERQWQIRHCARLLRAVACDPALKCGPVTRGRCAHDARRHLQVMATSASRCGAYAAHVRRPTSSSLVRPGQRARPRS